MPRPNKNPHPICIIRKALRNPDGSKINQEKFAEMLGIHRSTLQAIEQRREDFGSKLTMVLAKKVFDVTGGVILPYTIELIGQGGVPVSAVVPIEGEALDLRGETYSEASYRAWIKPVGEKNPAIREMMKRDLLIRFEALLDAAGESAIGEVEFNVMRLFQNLRTKLGLEEAIEVELDRISEERADAVTVAEIENLDMARSWGWSIRLEDGATLDQRALSELMKELEGRGVTKVRLVKRVRWPVDLLSGSPESKKAAALLADEENSQMPRLECLNRDGKLIRSIPLVHENREA